MWGMTELCPIGSLGGIKVGHSILVSYQEMSQSVEANHLRASGRHATPCSLWAAWAAAANGAPA